jgi:EmrB/QacA subfamily drug resistance transporter
MTSPASTTDRPSDESTGTRLGLVITGVMLGMLLAALDQTIVSTALPRIVGDLGGANHLSWVVTAYLLASTASTPLWGKLGDLLGRKTLYQVCIVLFLIGSALCGMAHNMVELIAFRALQGLGGGGLIVLSQAIIGDVVPPRDRGRYQGLMGAMFGVASVIGPLLGGFFVDNLTWRWVFYVNLPVGAVALVVIMLALHTTSREDRPRIDYLGTALLAAASTCLVLVTSLGGTTWQWNSAQVYGLCALAVLLLVGFGYVETKAAEPIMPPSLFRNRVFTASSAVAFVVGFCMLGGLSYLPLLLQVVNGDSPTMSGLRLLPMMGGVLVASIGGGQLISRWGRYRVFPIVGTLVMSVGMYLLSTMTEHTSTLDSSVYMLVFGLGLGMVMQVLVLAAQNAVEYHDLGAATSGVTYFRSIGGSFGASVFGTILNSRLASNLSDALRTGKLPPNFPAARIKENPTAAHQLPAPMRDPFLHVYSQSMHTVFLTAVPICLLAFLLTLLLKEVPLRRTNHGPDTGEAFGMPSNRSSLDEIERSLTLISSRESLIRRYRQTIDRAGVDIEVPLAYGLVRLHHIGPMSAAQLSTRFHKPVEMIEPYLRQLVDRGYARDTGDGRVELTDSGEAVVGKLTDARRTILAEVLDGWSPEQYEELQGMLRRIADDSLDDPDKRNRLLYGDTAPATR